MDRFLNWFLTLKDVYPRQHCTSQSRKAAGEKSKKLTQGQLVKSMPTHDSGDLRLRHFFTR
jgi:hypothetical protein